MKKTIYDGCKTSKENRFTRFILEVLVDSVTDTARLSTKKVTRFAFYLNKEM